MKPNIPDNCPAYILRVVIFPAHELSHLRRAGLREELVQIQRVRGLVLLLQSRRARVPVVLPTTTGGPRRAPRRQDRRSRCDRLHIHTYIHTYIHMVKPRWSDKATTNSGATWVEEGVLCVNPFEWGCKPTPSSNCHYMKMWIRYYVCIGIYLYVCMYASVCVYLCVGGAHHGLDLEHPLFELLLFNAHFLLRLLQLHCHRAILKDREKHI